MKFENRGMNFYVAVIDFSLYGLAATFCQMAFLMSELGECGFVC